MFINFKRNVFKRSCGKLYFLKTKSKPVFKEKAKSFLLKVFLSYLGYWYDAENHIAFGSSALKSIMQFSKPTLPTSYKFHPKLLFSPIEIINVKFNVEIFLFEIGSS
ncbi:MAG TPA: hypothetical protein VEC36_01480 [Patescibacteria group bacterium]|nr:hypothetical protein [Patescibacteria group bacterium]